jgi:hypothetical protein
MLAHIRWRDADVSISASARFTLATVDDAVHNYSVAFAECLNILSHFYDDAREFMAKRNGNTFASQWVRLSWVFCRTVNVFVQIGSADAAERWSNDYFVCLAYWIRQLVDAYVFLTIEANGPHARFGMTNLCLGCQRKWMNSFTPWSLKNKRMNNTHLYMF